jgi:hypothetical protein
VKSAPGSTNPDAQAATKFHDAHIPNIAEQKGFLDVVMVGTLIELADIINRWSYTKTNPPAVIEEQNAARAKYRRFLVWYASTYILLLDETLVGAWYVAHRMLVEVAAAIAIYKRETTKITVGVAKCTTGSVKLAVVRFLQRDWPELLPKFEQLLEQRKPQLYWTGPSLNIRRRSNAPVPAIVKEWLDYPAQPIYLAKDANKGTDVEMDGPTDPTAATILDGENAIADAGEAVVGQEPAMEGIETAVGDEATAAGPSKPGTSHHQQYHLAHTIAKQDPCFCLIPQKGQRRMLRAWIRRPRELVGWLKRKHRLQQERPL